MDRILTDGEYHGLWTHLVHLTDDARFVPTYNGGKLFIADYKMDTVYMNHSSLDQRNVDDILQSTRVDTELYSMFISIGLSIEAALMASLEHGT